VVRYMLFHQFEKPWVPVTHVKVREVLMKEFVSKSGREDLPGSSKIPSVSACVCVCVCVHVCVCACLCV